MSALKENLKGEPANENARLQPGVDKANNDTKQDSASEESKQRAENGLAQYQRLFTRKPNAIRSSLNRESLPTPLQYLSEHGLLKGKSRSEWATIVCPAHKSGAEQHPSLRVSQIDGHFRCLACGAKGGDIVALHRLITGFGFRDAVTDLGGRFHE